MRKIWAVIRREFMERIKSRWFLVSTILGPVFMVGTMVVPVIIATRGARERTIAVADFSTDGFGKRLATELDGSKELQATWIPAPPGHRDALADSLESVVVAKGLDGYLVVTDSLLSAGRVDYRGSNVSSPRDAQNLERLVEESVMTERLTKEGVNPDAVRRARISVEVTGTKVGGAKGSTESGKGSFILAYIMWFVLYVAIIIYGQNVLGSVVEEKTSRVIEVLISSLRPFQLMAGKIIGVGAVGLLQLGIWGSSAMLLGAYRSEMMSMFSASPDMADMSFIPQISVLTAAIFLAYFVLGYFLYAAMFAAVAAMSSTEAEARQAMTPVIMLLVVPSVMMIGILNDPNGTLAHVLGLVPFFSPIAMPVRWAAAPLPISEVILSLVVLVITLVGVTWVAARIYRIGILMYGKRPTLPELLRWIRTS